MRFAASNDPQTTTRGELVVLTYKQQHVVVLLPPAYEDAVDEARKQFNLSKGDITFSTSYLPHPSCHDLSVRIDQKAWNDVKSIVPRMTVLCEGSEREGSHDDGPLPMILENGGPVGPSYAQEDELHASSDDPVPASAMRRRQSVGPSTHRSRHSRARGQSLAPSPAKYTTEDTLGNTTGASSQQPQNSVPGPASSKQRVSSSSTKAPRQPAPRPDPKLEPASSQIPAQENEDGDVEMQDQEPIIEDDDLLEESEEDDQEAPPPSPKKAAKRQRIESDDEGEDNRRSSQRAKLEKSQGVRTSTTTSGKTTAPVTPKKASSSTAKGSSASLHKSTAATAKTPKASTSEEGLITFDIALQLWNEEAESEDKLDEEVMAFKAKAKHTMRKVISSALKQFTDLEGFPIEQIGLYFTKDGQEIRCQLDQTVAELGIMEGDQLIMTAYEEEDVGEDDSDAE